MSIPKALTVSLSIVILAVVLAMAFLVTRPVLPALTDVEFGSSAISPNADGQNDATVITYRLRREATVSIYFERSGDARRFYFRKEQVRPRGTYTVLFSGVVEGYVNENEDIASTVLSRLLPDGSYTWTIQADDGNDIYSSSGALEIADSDVELPDLIELSVSPAIFTPNQDGINDRVEINVYIPKPARLQVSLIDENGERIFIPEMFQGRAPGEPGRHSFEYDGGIDNGSDPPPDGTYTVLVDAEDDEGQRAQRSATLTIRNGGVPLAEIVGQPGGDTIRFSSETVLIGDVLTFELTVWNYGEAPIRTTGPAPGYVYNQSELFSNTGFYEESGAWRVGISCDTCLADYPWRWGLGDESSLTVIRSEDGRTHYYLMPGDRAVITGGVRLENIVESRNPQQFWAGLIHEDVGIAPLNNRVDPRWIEIVESD